MDHSVSIVSDLDGSKIALINEIHFRSRRNIDWKEAEQYLKRYIGKCFEITETAESVYIGSDFPDEFSHSNDTKELKGANMKAKANTISAICELVQIATNKMEYPDYKSKHWGKAKFGWYRYDIRFGIPVYDDKGKLERYNIFSARMLVRRNEDGRLFLYDLVRTKKETSRPHKYETVR